MPSLFQSISALFGSKDARHMNRDQAILSVDDAFSIPPDTEYVTTSKAYTYPPPAREGSYDTVPQSAFSPSTFDLRSPLSARSRPSPLLPLTRSPLSPLPPYPPLSRTWDRIRNWLEINYPELGDTLNYGISPADLAEFEAQLGFALPQTVRESYLMTDGQEPESAAGCSEGLLFGLTLLPLDFVVEEWRRWREVDEDPATGANPGLIAHQDSIPPHWIRREYSQRGWIPLAADKAGNFLGIDMNPDSKGTAGQVIVFGRDFDTKVVMWRGEGEAGWARWLASFVEELEAGEGFELGGLDGSDGSEDDVGYESYFFDANASSRGTGVGGDSGAGGLRLVGEYKGWPVLEAFADRSMRRWIEAGIMPPIEEPRAASAEPEAGPSGTQREDEQTSEPPPPVQMNGSTVTLSHHTRKPSTSLPAPRPIVLPTEDDIIPPPGFLSSHEPSSYDEADEESAMRELEQPTPVQADFPSVSPKRSIPSGTHVRQMTDPDISDSQNLLTAVTPTSGSPILLTHEPEAGSEEEEEVPASTVRLVEASDLASSA